MPSIQNPPKIKAMGNLDIQNLKVSFHTREGIIHAVDGVDLVEHAEQVRTAPHDLLAADTEVHLVAVAERQRGVDVELAQPAMVAAELRHAQLVLVTAEIPAQAAARVDVAGPDRGEELEAAAELAGVIRVA